MSYEVQLPLFKGPFDLLLFFIERDELEINDKNLCNLKENYLFCPRICSFLKLDVHHNLLQGKKLIYFFIRR